MKVGFVSMSVLAAISVVAVASSVAISAQDRSTLRVPDGLSFDEFNGYESWETVTVSQNDGAIKLMAANPTMIAAFKAGIPANGKPFPDGSRIVKLEWSRKVNSTSPAGPIAEPDKLRAVEFIVKDTKRFPNNKNGWAFGIFFNNAATQTLTPVGSGTVCGSACHAKVADRDYIFNRYAPR